MRSTWLTRDAGSVFPRASVLMVGRCAVDQHVAGRAGEAADAVATLEAPSSCEAEFTAIVTSDQGQLPPLTPPEAKGRKSQFERRTPRATPETPLKSKHDCAPIRRPRRRILEIAQVCLADIPAHEVGIVEHRHALGCDPVQRRKERLVAVLDSPRRRGLRRRGRPCRGHRCRCRTSACSRALARAGVRRGTACRICAARPTATEELCSKSA